MNTDITDTTDTTKGHEPIPVLDHGFVRLVDSMGTDVDIVRAARVSYDAAWRAGENEGSDTRLLNYLLRNKHTTPFEAVEFQFEVYAPVFVIRQWQRHRTWTYNELSGRYKPLPEEFYLPEPEDIGVISKDNKQGRDRSEMHPQAAEIFHFMDRHMKLSVELANTLRELEVPNELARLVLPMANYTHMFAKVDLHNLLHFLRLRQHEHAQFEIRQYARALHQIAKEVVPVTMEIFEEISLQEKSLEEKERTRWDRELNQRRHHTRHNSTGFWPASQTQARKS